MSWGMGDRGLFLHIVSCCFPSTASENFYKFCGKLLPQNCNKTNILLAKFTKNAKCSFSSNSPSISKIMLKSQYESCFPNLFKIFKGSRIFMNIDQHELGSSVQLKMISDQKQHQESCVESVTLIFRPLKCIQNHFRPIYASK